MYPELLQLDLPVIGSFTITSFGAMMAIAFLAGHQVIRYRLSELGRPQELADEIVMGALIGGLLGAKLYYVALASLTTGIDPLRVLFSRGGLVWYGGLLGGTLGVILAARRRGATVPFTADLVAPALALSYGLGRIGCFLVGDDYGRPTESWIGIAFPEGYPPTTAGRLRAEYGADIPPSVADWEVVSVFPTQLFEVGAALVIFYLLWRWRNHIHRTGWLFSVWLVAAGLERFLIEIFRVKDDRILGPLTIAQLISIGLIVLGVYLWNRLSRPGATATDG